MFLKKIIFFGIVFTVTLTKKSTASEWELYKVYKNPQETSISAAYFDPLNQNILHVSTEQNHVCININQQKKSYQDAPDHIYIKTDELVYCARHNSDQLYIGDQIINCKDRYLNHSNTKNDKQKIKFLNFDCPPILPHHFNSQHSTALIKGDRSFYLYNLKTKKNRPIKADHTSAEISNYCLNPKENVIAYIVNDPYGLKNNKVYIITRKSEKSISYPEPILAVRFCNKQLNHLTVTTENYISIINFTRKHSKQIFFMENTQHNISEACLSGDYLACKEKDRTIIMNISNNKIMTELPGINDNVPMNCFSNDGNYLVIPCGHKVLIYKKNL